MEEKRKIYLECPHCGNKFRCNAPSAPGRYSVPCPNPECGQKVKFNYNVSSPANGKKEEPKLGWLEDGSYRFKCSNNSCCQLVKVPAEQIKVGKNTVYCPKCNTVHEFEKVPSEAELLTCQTADCDGKLEMPSDKDGIYSAVCSKCSNEYSIIITDGSVRKTIMKTPTPLPAIKKNQMKLVLGHFIGKKEYILSKGSHYIGRYDEADNSDFAVKDKFASKRSLRIDVNENGGNLVYKLTVERALNPVYHNNRELTVGDIVYLMYDDTIRIGKTLIKVQKVKK